VFSQITNGRANARKRATPADIADRSSQLVVGWRGIAGEERADGHDHAGLAITTLRDLVVDPGLLHRMKTCCAKPFNGDDLYVSDRAHRDAATAHSFAVDMDGAGSARTYAAAEFCAGEMEFVAKNPEQRGFGLDVDVMIGPVDV
jgi:hypothetical protein